MSKEVPIDMATSRPVDLGSEWNSNYPILLRRARRLARGGSQDPEDLISQATVKVLSYLECQRECDNFVGLMLMSLLQVFLDNKRRYANRIFFDADPFAEEYGHADWLGHEGCTEHRYIARETVGDIFSYIASMPPHAQNLFQLRFVRDLSYQEIAESLGVTEVCARQKVRKLRQKLQLWIDK